MIVAVVGAECVLRCWPPRENAQPPGPRALGNIFGALAVGLITVALAVPLYRGEALRYEARYQIDQMARNLKPTIEEQRTVLTDADTALQEAALLDPANGQTWADRAYVSALWVRLAPARADELGRQADEQARAALARSKSVAEFWVRLGVALDLQGEWAQATLAFGRAIQLAPLNATIWYYQAYHFSLTPSTHTLAEAAVREALVLDPQFQPAIILQQSLTSPR
jgi:tetratricopeptide (TPR) repeat protein